MPRLRLSDAAWLLLKRLNEQSAELAVCGDPSCYRFHIVSGGVRGEIVRNLTMQGLVASGFLQRSRSSSPTYRVARKGIQALKRKGFLIDEAADYKNSDEGLYMPSETNFEEVYAS